MFSFDLCWRSGVFSGYIDLQSLPLKYNVDKCSCNLRLIRKQMQQQVTETLGADN